VISAAALLVWLLAQDAAPGTQDAKRLLSEAVAAQGSPAAIAAVTSLTAFADCTGPGGNYKTFHTEVISLRPDRALFRQTAGGHTVELFVAGDVGWSRNVETGAVEPLPPAMMGIVRGHEFHLMFLELDRRYRNPRLAGRDMVGERACLVVAMTDAAGKPASVCVDEESKLPLRVSFEPPGGPKPQTIHVMPRRWTEVAGIRWVGAFTLRQGDETYTYDYTSIRPNSVDPKMFEVPPGLRRSS
jgi:hypothetical protein